MSTPSVPIVIAAVALCAVLVMLIASFAVSMKRTERAAADKREHERLTVWLEPLRNDSGLPPWVHRDASGTVTIELPAVPEDYTGRHRSHDEVDKPVN